MADLVGVGGALVAIISKIIQQCEQRTENAQVMQELHSFLQSLQDYIQQTQEKALVLRNNSALWALGALQKDLENAILTANKILNKGFVRSLWDANKIQSRLQALRDRVMTSFQTRLSVAALDVAIEGKQAQDAFQEAMQESCFSLKEEQHVALRKELRKALQPITIAMKSHTHRIEAAVSMIHSLQPQTSDTEKFFEDVLGALGGLSVKNQGDAASSSSSSSGPVTHASGSAKRSPSLVKWYEDPVTWEIMCDPVKATDGHTYDRWTILRKPCHMATSPFRPDDLRPFHIATDDIDVRSRLFHKFPEQESQFRAKRAAYRDAALHEAQAGHFADSVSMLRHVLEWAPHDVECSEKLQYVQRQMRAASGKSIPSADDANLFAREVDQSRQDANTRSSATLVQPQHLYPSRLDSARSNRRLLLLSQDGLSCRFCSTAATVESDNIGAAIADMAVPVRYELLRSTTVFYFEITIEELGGNNVVGLGFSGSQSFLNNFLPGRYLNSCGLYQVGDRCYIFADGRQQGGVGQRIARKGDTMGAGIHHGHKEIFFVYNGSLIAVITNTLSGRVMPIVALRSPRACVKVAFNDSAFCPEQRPSRLVISDPNIQGSNIVSLSPDGLIAQYIAQPVPPQTIAELPVVSLQANCGACFRHPSQSYYFELTVINKGDCGYIAIGFAHQNFFQANKQPGWYLNSCAYHGDDGNLFFGYSDMAQNFGPTFSAGDTIGAGIDHASNTIFFIKNGKKVGHTSRLRMSCALYPVIGLHSPDEVVSLNFGQAPFSFNTSITPNLDIIEQPTRLVPSYFRSICVSLSQDGLRAHYIARRQSRGGFLPVAALMADRAICTFRRSSQVYYFELTVLNKGESGYIAIGFCNQDHFDCHKQPGWYPNSCGYHGDDGRLYIGDPMGLEFGPTFTKLDVIGAGVDYSTNTIFFAKNGCLVGDTRQMNISYALCPIIGLHSTEEEVHLNFGQAPFSFDTSQLH
ncbi:hypothetical protein GOP47_0027315 [Adiantum capillus-veneris]|nr:hypothetical protein GOP47_0027315 [Adiantum capillus-veneris]